MATYHQRKAGPITLPAGKYSVVIDPPNRSRAVVAFDNEAMARTYLRAIEERGECYARLVYVPAADLSAG